MNMPTSSMQEICPPVLFLIFNRPKMSQRVFEQIREARPSQLFIAADGPRSDKAGETKLIKRTRQEILERIDWPCDVKTLFRERNLGCKQAVSSAITWFFKHVEQGIILEDDCRPDLSFFRFCGSLLQTYRDNEQIMMISGNCHLPAHHQPVSSYYFSRFTYIWGWATWRRAWKKIDMTMSGWNAESLITDLPDTLRPSQKKYWSNTFSANVSKGSSWAIVWQYSCWRAGGITINPSINLVSHIDNEGTHMKPYDPLIDKKSHAIAFPLKHPDSFKIDHQADRVTESRVRRSTATNLCLILKYLLILPFNRNTSIPAGLHALSKSLSSEIRHRSSLSSR